MTPTTVLALLMQHWPVAFPRIRVRPLKLNIHLEILAALGDAITAEELSAALTEYVSSRRYLNACCRAGRDRVGLDGVPAGKVTAEEANYAVCKRARL